MFVWAPIPEPYREIDSLEFASLLIQECEVATSPGVGFGPGGDGFVRFALIENEQRIAQGVRNIRTGPHASCSRRARRPRPGSHGRHAVVTRASLPCAVDGALRACASGCPIGLARSGQVASRIGSLRGDVIGIEILERGAGRAIDELVVSAARGRARRAAGRRDRAGRRGRRRGRPRAVVGEPHDPQVAALAIAERMADAEGPDGVLDVLCSRAAPAPWTATGRPS